MEDCQSWLLEANVAKMKTNFSLMEKFILIHKGPILVFGRIAKKNLALFKMKCVSRTTEYALSAV
jgi:hypothetical protein